WQELATCALLGTERRTPSISSLADSEDALAQLLARLDAEDREGILLRAAGVMALWQRAGQPLADDPQPPPSPCEPDEIPDCGPQASAHLALLLQGHYAELLPEWLTLLATAERRVPEEWLPALLDTGTRQATLRPLLLPVLGRRGHWLAQYNPLWSYAIEAADEAVWQTGRFEERLSLLRQLRATQPERARELLATTWKEELVRQRREFIQTLAIGLSPADEPLLETALDDRSVEVVHAAANLLARLPQSRLSQEATAHALRLLHFQPGGLLRRARLEADLPEDEPVLRRDGITTPPSGSTLGKKAWRLSQIVGATPIAVWSREWAQSPAKIIAASRDCEWRQALLEGWVLATQRHRDPDWAEALLPLYPDHAEWTAALVDVLPPDRFEAYLLELLRDAATSDGRATALVVLNHVERPWSIALSQAVLEQVRRRVRQDKQPDWWLANTLRGFARWIPPEFSDVAATGWPRESQHWPQWESVVHDFLDRLRFRKGMRDALA
ncbi:MAG: hypothetical protein IAF00_05240, partial [Phycisphaerales bacterium]|nr:hypothetical protein [Phycisphaerales bacterium]